MCHAHLSTYEDTDGALMCECACCGIGMPTEQSGCERDHLCDACFAAGCEACDETACHARHATDA